MRDVQEVEDSDNKVLLGTTSNDKEIYLVRKPNCSVRMIAFGSGGQLPQQLSGGFSSLSAALHATNAYLAKVKAKEIKVDGTKYSGK